MDFFGNNFKNTNFHWFTGVVEDIADPYERGRVKVRCFGYHTESLDVDDGIPTYALPWAQVMTPITSAGCGGVGRSATGVVRGSWVVGFFRDGEACQDPIILGTLPSQTPEPTKSGVGFQDNYGEHPRNVLKGVPILNDQPLGATENYKEAQAYKNKSSASFVTQYLDSDGQIAGVPTAVPPQSEQLLSEHPKDSSNKENTSDFNNKYFERKRWLQPPQEEVTKPLYPYCHTTEYNCGHVVEFDETPNEERILIHHKSGTYTEIDGNGNKVQFVSGENYRIIIEDENVNIKGNCNITIDGDARTYIKGSSYTEVDGNYHLNVKGNIYKECQSEFNDIIADQVSTIGKMRKSSMGHSEIVDIQALHQFDEDANAYVSTDSPGTNGAAYQLNLKNNAKITIGGSEDKTIHKNLDFGINGDANITTQGNRIDIVNTGYKIQVTGNTTAANNILDIDTKGKITIDTTNDIDLHAGTSGTVDIDGPTAINLN